MKRQEACFMDLLITIHNIDDEIVRLLEEEVKESGVSVDTLIGRLIQEKVTLSGRKPQKQVYHDLDALAGTWSRGEANIFLDAVADFGKVDKNL